MSTPEKKLGKFEEERYITKQFSDLFNFFKGKDKESI